MVSIAVSKLVAVSNSEAFSAAEHSTEDAEEISRLRETIESPAGLVLIARTTATSVTLCKENRINGLHDADVVTTSEQVTTCLFILLFPVAVVVEVPAVVVVPVASWVTVARAAAAASPLCASVSAWKYESQCSGFCSGVDPTNQFCELLCSRRRQETVSNSYRK